MIGGCFIWSSTKPEVVKIIPYKVKEDKYSLMVPPQIEGVVKEIPASECTSAAIIHLPQHWSGTPSMAKVILFIQKTLKCFCFANITKIEFRSCVSSKMYFV